MGKVRLLVLDILKPHQPSIMKLAAKVSDLDGIDGVDITVYEIDSKVENVKATIKGGDIDYDAVNETIENFGATTHSIDKVTCGDVVVKEEATHQDSPA